jgi:hypothetical protein
MDTFQFIQHLAVALAIGLMIGIERGWKQREEAEGERAAGLRTLALAGLLGGVWGALARSFGAWGVLALGLAFAVFTAAIVLFRWREIEHAKSYGATTAVAAMLAFSLGAFAMVDMVAAAAAGVATAMLLALKTALHGWLERLTWEELRAGLVLLAMTVILLPILPDREIGPLGALNPHEIWLMTITIAVLSFAGYVAIRVAGAERGVVLSGLAGGLVSSTAVTLTMAKLGRDHPERQRLCAAASLLASTVMALRVLAIASVFNATLVYAGCSRPLVLPSSLRSSSPVRCCAGRRPGTRRWPSPWSRRTPSISLSSSASGACGDGRPPRDWCPGDRRHRACVRCRTRRPLACCGLGFRRGRPTNGPKLRLRALQLTA